MRDTTTVVQVTLLEVITIHYRKQVVSKQVTFKLQLTHSSKISVPPIPCTVPFLDSMRQ